MYPPPEKYFGIQIFLQCKNIHKISIYWISMKYSDATLLLCVPFCKINNCKYYLSVKQCSIYEQKQYAELIVKTSRKHMVCKE